MQAKMRSDRKKSPTMYEIRELTFDELKRLSNHAYILDQAGQIANVKITSVKSWKTRPNNLDIHCKYGLYDYFIVHVVDCNPDMTFIEIIYDQIVNTINPPDR